MRKQALYIFIIVSLITSCGGTSNKKRSLDSTLFKYASLIRWSDFDNALHLLKPGVKQIVPSGFELQRLKQFKVSQYLESPISPSNDPNVILQNVEIQLYNIHTNKAITIYDHQSWEYSEEMSHWFNTSGLPKL